MNNKLATAMKEVIRDKWNPKTHNLNSKEVYEELIARGVEVPPGDMNEIIGEFKKAGIITGPGYMDSTGVQQHGATVIARVNLDLLEQVEFD
jgi:hypothetical protein